MDRVERVHRLSVRSGGLLFQRPSVVNWWHAGTGRRVAVWHGKRSAVSRHIRMYRVLVFVESWRPLEMDGLGVGARRVCGGFISLLVVSTSRNPNLVRSLCNRDADFRDSCRWPGSRARSASLVSCEGGQGRTSLAVAGRSRTRTAISVPSHWQGAGPFSDRAGSI